MTAAAASRGLAQAARSSISDALPRLSAAEFTHHFKLAARADDPEATTHQEFTGHRVAA